MAQRDTMYFGDDGVLYNASDATTSEKIDALIELLKLFLAGLASCGRTEAGNYSLIDKHSGYRSGSEVLWKKIGSLALLLHLDSYHGLTAEEQKIMAEKGSVVRNPKLRFNATPLADLVYRIAFSIPWESNTKWVKEIPNQTGQQLRATLDELVLYKDLAERDERKTPPDPDRIDQSKWATRSDLENAMDVHRTTLRDYLKASGFTSKKLGGAASKERISPSQVLSLRRFLLTTHSPDRSKRIERLARWSDPDPQLDGNSMSSTPPLK